MLKSVLVKVRYNKIYRLQKNLALVEFTFNFHIFQLLKEDLDVIPISWSNFFFPIIAVSLYMGRLFNLSFKVLVILHKHVMKTP